jgi:hypothetical protein
MSSRLTATDFAARFGVKVLTGIQVSMRDGASLNVRLTRPDALGRFPAIIEYSPYRRLGEALPDYRDERPPVVPYLAERGYVVVQFDVRGTGNSSGHCAEMYSDDERRDGYDMVEWAAAQEWCTGAVGMLGISYGAVVQWQVAVQAPPHLNAIVVRSGCDDVYGEFTNPGGCIRPWLFETYGPMMNAYNFAPPDPAIAGARWEVMWRERLANSVPWTLSFLRNLLDGPYWRSRSVAPDFGRVKCPVLLVEGWADWYASAELRAFQNLTVPKKILIGPWGHYYAEESRAYPGPRIDARRDYLKWFDRWLKNIDNGVMDEPPVTVFVRSWQTPARLCIETAGQWRSAASWPPREVRATDFFFASHGKLGDAPVKGSETYDYRASVGVAAGRRGLGTTSPWGMPLDQRADDACSVLYETGPLAEPMELLGEPQAVLHVSSTAQVAYFHVRLCDVAPDGASRLVSDGGLLATHRASHERPEPLVPGQIYELRIALMHCADVLARGHRLRVAVAGAEFQNAWPTGMPARNTIFRGAAHPSRVVLPVAGADREHLPAPHFEESPFPLWRGMPQPGYALHRDPAADTVTCELANTDGNAHNTSRYTVSDRDPAAAKIESRFRYRPPQQARHIEIDAACTTESDADSYRHTSRVEIRIDATLYFEKTWTESVGRNGS